MAHRQARRKLPDGAEYQSPELAWRSSEGGGPEIGLLGSAAILD
jgi:hypothetical protein